MNKFEAKMNPNDLSFFASRKCLKNILWEGVSSGYLFTSTKEDMEWIMWLFIFQVKTSQYGDENIGEERSVRTYWLRAWFLCYVHACKHTYAYIGTYEYVCM